MEASFYQENRKALLDFLPDHSAAVLFSGMRRASRRTLIILFSAAGIFST